MIKKISRETLERSFRGSFRQEFKDTIVLITEGPYTSEVRIHANISGYMLVSEIDSFCAILGLDMINVFIIDNETIGIFDCEVI